MSYDEKLKELGFELPPPPGEAGNYVDLKPFGQGLVYVSGTGGDIEGEEMVRGRLGAELTIEQGKVDAQRCALNILASIYAKYGTLDVIKSIVKLTVFVSSAQDFYEQPAVANGATNLFVQLFGEKVGKPSRSAIGVYSLPENIAVEIEGIFEIDSSKAI